MNQTVDSRKYYPTALVLYITYFVLGIAASIMGQYKHCLLYTSPSPRD